jgi:hypothetical protein
MRGTRIENEVEICATNITNKTERMSTNAMKWVKYFQGMQYLPLVPSVE